MTEKYYENLLNDIDFSVAEHEMIYDKAGNPIGYKFLYVNKVFCVSLNMKEEEIIGKNVLDILPNTETSWIERYNNVVQSGKAINFINYSEALDEYFSVYAFKSKPNCFVTSFKNITSYVKAGSHDVKDDLMSNLFTEGKHAYFEFDLKNRKFEYSAAFSNILGIDVFTYKDYTNLFKKFTHPADKKRVEESVDKMFSGKVDEITIQMRLYNPKRQDYVWVSYFAYSEKRYRGVPVVIRGILKNIDSEKRQSIELKQMDTMFKETRKIANITTFYYSFRDKIFSPSSELDEFLGIERISLIDQIRNIVHPEDIDEYDFSTEEIMHTPIGVVSKYRIIKNNEVRYIESSVFGDIDEAKTVVGAFGILKDVTDLEKSKREIEYFANFDVLTGLYNRNNFEKLNKTLDKMNGVGVLICDVDGLKLINDAFGHIEGDELLVHLARTLKDVGGSENVYRIGGDEFVVIVYDAIEETVLKMEKQIKEAIHKFRLHSVGFDVSIGYGFIDIDKTFVEAFREAENLMYRRKLTERKSRKSNALRTIMQTMHERTEETEEHCQRVAKLSSELLKMTGRKRDYEIEEIKLVAEVHDIGKISISDTILGKPTKLTEAEYEKIKYHSESGYKIISNIIDNEDIAIAVLYHHEKWDGTGYPHELKGDKIPLYSRVVSICDAYDAMTSDRVYREAFSKKQAIREITRNSGTQFDPELVEYFLKIVK